MGYPYRNGNRMAVPSAVNSKHFFYQAKVPCLPQDEVNRVVEATMRFIEDEGLHTAQIQLVTKGLIQKYGGQAAVDSLQCLVKTLGMTDVADHDVSILACEWASVHHDDMFEGRAFASVVLHTGPERYVVQSFHTQVKESENGRGLKLTAETRVLNAGDAFVLDPTTPHMAAPESPTSNCLLILLQFELDDHNKQERQKIVKRFPPVVDDEDRVEVFHGFF